MQIKRLIEKGTNATLLGWELCFQDDEAKRIFIRDAPDDKPFVLKNAQEYVLIVFKNYTQGHPVAKVVISDQFLADLNYIHQKIRG